MPIWVISVSENAPCVCLKNTLAYSVTHVCQMKSIPICIQDVAVTTPSALKIFSYIYSVKKPGGFTRHLHYIDYWWTVRCDHSSMTSTTKSFNSSCNWLSLIRLKNVYLTSTKIYIPEYCYSAHSCLEYTTRYALTRAYSLDTECCLSIQCFEHSYASFGVCNTILEFV